MLSAHKCPKCGGELSDWYDPENTDFIGEWSDDRFRCEGKLVEAKDDRYGDYVWVNRTKSCGYFGLEDLGGEKMKNIDWNYIAYLVFLAVVFGLAVLG